MSTNYGYGILQYIINKGVGKVYSKQELISGAELIMDTESKTKNGFFGRLIRKRNLEQALNQLYCNCNLSKVGPNAYIMSPAVQRMVANGATPRKS